MDQFRQPTEPWKKRLGAEKAETAKYQRRKLVELKEVGKIDEVYVGGFRDEMGDRHGRMNYYIYFVFQFLNNRTKKLVDTMVPGRTSGAIPTKEEVCGLALTHIDARGVWELSFDDAAEIDILNYFGVQLNEQNKLYLLIERSNSLTQQNCFQSMKALESQKQWEKQHLKPRGEWTREGIKYSKAIDIILPVLEFNVKGGHVEITTKPTSYLFVEGEDFIFVAEFNRSFKIVSLKRVGAGVDVELRKSGGEYGIFQVGSSEQKLKIVLEVPDGFQDWGVPRAKADDHSGMLLDQDSKIAQMMEKLSGKLTIVKKVSQGKSFAGKPWVCDFKLPTEEHKIAWRVELAEPRLPLGKSKGGRILYSVIGTGYDSNDLKPDEFKEAYQENFGTAGPLDQQNFRATHIPTELVKIRDMSQNPDSFTLKDNGFCYVDMTTEFHRTQNYHYSTPLLHMLHAFLGGPEKLDPEEQEDLEQIFNENKQFLILVSHKLISKIFGNHDIIKTEHSPFHHKYTLDIGGETIMIEIKFDDIAPLNYRKGASQTFPTLHMDYGIRAEIRKPRGVARGIVDHGTDNSRLINYWVNLTRDKPTPEFQHIQGTPIREQFAAFKTTFDTYKETSMGNSLYSNSLVLLDKSITADTLFVELTGKVTPQAVAKPIDYSVNKDESGMLPVTYDGLNYGCGFFFSSQEVMHAGLTYTADSAALFHDPLKTFKEDMGLDEMRKIAISLGKPEEEVNSLSKSVLRVYLSPFGGWEELFAKEKEREEEAHRKKKEEEVVTKIQALVRGKQAQARSEDPKQKGGAYDPFREVIRESFEVRFIVKITNEKNEPLTNEYLGEPQIGKKFTTI